MTESVASHSSRVFLVRHGRTVLNAQDRLRGLADPPLDDVGIAQAEAVAAVLGGHDIREVLSSPLQRAVRTAQIIAGVLGVSHRIDPGFNDRDYGPWTGHERSEVRAEFGTVDAAPGVEPTAAVLARAMPALDAVLPLDGAVAVVTHDAVIRPLLEELAGSSIDVDIGTGSWSELTHGDAGWRVVSAGNLPPAA